MSQSASFNSLSIEQNKDTKRKAPFLDKLRKEAAEVKAAPVFQSIPHDDILSRLLSSISTIDFRTEANGAESDKEAKRYEQIVICIEKIIEAADVNGWPMCHQNGAAYLFNGAWWRMLENGDAQAFLGKAAERLGLSRNVARYVDTRKKLLEQFTSTAYMKAPKRSHETVLINLMNGTFEIDGTEPNLSNPLRAPRPADFLTYQLPFNYDDQAQAPLFMEYLNKVQPDPNRQDVLAEFLGSVFLPSLKHEKALLLYGTGANGKSVFFDITKALLGESNVASYSLKSLTGDRGANARAMLENKLLNYASEIGNGIGEIDTFKSLVSCEPIEARRLYQDVYQLTWHGRFIFNCNELPHDTEQTNAFFRRCLIVPFDVTLPEAEWDRSLSSKIIKTELAGVFNWMLAGLSRLIAQQAFTHCEAAEQKLNEWRKASCSVRQFIDASGYQPDPFSNLPWSEIYSDYTAFCRENGVKPVGTPKFSSRLKGIGFEIGHGRIGIYTGTVVHAKK